MTDKIDGRKNRKKTYDRNAKITCDCGGKYINKNKSTHCKSKRHQRFINNEKETRYTGDTKGFGLPLDLLDEETRKKKKAYYQDYSKKYYEEKKKNAKKILS